MSKKSKENKLYLLEQYEKFLDCYFFNPEILKWFFSQAYNFFYSGYLLANKGLLNQICNSMRMGFEYHWMGILLKRDDKLLKDWCLSVGMSNKQELLNELQTTQKIIKKLQDGEKIKIKDRKNIYEALSDRSHVKFKNIAILDMKLQIIGFPKKGLKSKYDISKCYKCADTCLSFALTEINEEFNMDLIKQHFKNFDLVHISNSGYEDARGDFVPFVTSKKDVQTDPMSAMAVLDITKNYKKYFKNNPRSKQ